MAANRFLFAITSICIDGGLVVFCILPDTARENSAERERLPTWLNAVAGEPCDLETGVAPCVCRLGLRCVGILAML